MRSEIPSGWDRVNMLVNYPKAIHANSRVVEREGGARNRRG